MRSLQRALFGAKTTPGLFLTTTAAVTLALALTGAFVLLLEVGHAWLARMVGAETLVVYCSPDVDLARAQALAAQVEGLGGVDEVRLESPALAAERLRAVLGAEQDDALDSVLTWSLQVIAADSTRLPEIASLASKLDGVDEVDYGEALFLRLQRFERVVTGVGYAFVALLLFACAFIVNMTVSLALFVRREEIAVQKIIGASDGFVVAPLLIEGALAGALGGLGAYALIGLGYGALRLRLQRFAEAALIELPQLLTPLVLAQLCALGAVVCVLGTFVAATRYLRQAE